MTNTPGDEVREALTVALDALNKAGGTALGVAMSGRSHPNPDGALMEVFEACRDAGVTVAAALSPRPAQDGGEADVDVLTGCADDQGLFGLRDIFEREFDGEDDPRIRAAQCLTRAEAEAVLEHRGDVIAALALPPMSSGDCGAGWRDITSAPKDGTVIDLWVEGPELGEGAAIHRVIASWVERFDWEPDEPPGWKVVLSRLPDEYTATHWMPLPSSPAPKEVKS